MIDYRTQTCEDKYSDVDSVFDTGGWEGLSRSWGVLKSCGKLATIAASGKINADDRTKQAFIIVEANRSQFADVARLIDSGILLPVTSGNYPITEVRGAYKYKSRRGKAVMRMV